MSEPPLKILAVVGSLVVLFAFALALGLHVSLRLTSSRLAIGNVLGTVFFLCVGTLLCIYLISLPAQSFPNMVGLADEFAFTDADERFELLIDIFVDGLARRADAG